jgi:hypothetical protein
LVQLAVSVTGVPTCADVGLAASVQDGGLSCHVTVTDAGALVPALLVAATVNVRAPGVEKPTLHVDPEGVQPVHE